MSYGSRNSFRTHVTAMGATVHSNTLFHNDDPDVFALSTWPKVSAETSIRIARGATRQMLFIGSGERLDPTIHSREPSCSVEINHHADGKVSVVCRDTPFICSLEFDCHGDRWNGFRSYTTYASMPANKKKKLLAMQRTGSGIWVLTFVGRRYRLEIRPGETLVVTHKPG